MSTDANNLDHQNTLLVDVGDLISSRPRATNRHYRFGERKSLGFDVEQSEQPYVDRAAMSARAVISTATKDRVGDVLLPVGCNLTNYKKNPVVLWGHGIEGLSLPIGTSMKDGVLGIEITEDAVFGTCWFSQSHLESAQIFELVCEGIVRATSVRETPIKSQLKTISGEQVLLVHEWELEEWSWCAIGVNPDAVAKAIGKNKLAGKPITPSIMKSLNAVAPPKTVTGVGFTETKSMTEETNPTPEETPADEGKQMSNQAPYGAQAIASVHAGLCGLTKCGDTSMKAMEHPIATPGLKGCIDRLKDEVTYLKGLHAECYPNAQLKDDMDASDADDSEMKAFLASGQRYQWQIGGIAAQLKAMSLEGNLTSVQQRQLDGLAASIDRLTSQAKSFVAKPVEVAPAKPEVNQISPEEQAKLDAAFAKLTAS